MKVASSPSFRPLQRTGQAVADLGTTISALPKFIYPTVVGNPQQESLIWSALDAMPMQHAVRPNSIQVVPNIDGGQNILGRNMSPVGRITLSEQGYGMQDPGTFQNTVNHEVGHSVDHRTGLFGVVTHTRPSDAAPFGQGPNVSDYANTNPREDFAESYELHRHDPGALRAVNPAKEDVLSKLDKPSFLERLVDRPAFRETGKWIGRQFHEMPALRTGLEILRQTGIATLALGGTARLTQGVVQGDSLGMAQGLLQTGAGVGLAMAPQAPWLGLVATAALGGNMGVKYAQERHADKTQTLATLMGASVGGAVGGFVAPLGLTALGYSVAGPVGGAIGLVTGGLLGGRVGAKLGAKAALGLTS